jgi:hypothetical protein
MNKSTSRGDVVNSPGFWSGARLLLHAIAEAGQASATAGLQLFMGPNGGLIWTESFQSDRWEPYQAPEFATRERSAPVEAESPVIVRPQERPRSAVDTLLEAPTSN